MSDSGGPGVRPGRRGLIKWYRSRARARPPEADTRMPTRDPSEFPVAEAYRLGAVDYLTKPLIPDILRAKVAVFADLFRKAERVRELERQRGEAARRAAEEQLRLMVESATDYAIFS